MWRFNHSAETLKEAVGLTKEDLPKSGREVIKALQEEGEKGLVKVATLIVVVQEELLDLCHPVALLWGVFDDTPLSRRVERIYKSLKELKEEYKDDFPRAVATLITDCLAEASRRRKGIGRVAIVKVIPLPTLPEKNGEEH